MNAYLRFISLMTDQRDENSELLPDKEQLTKLGQFVRSTSIDNCLNFLMY